MGSGCAGIATVTDHGGSLDRARALFPDAALPWIDLSTGINPHSYPVSRLPATAFSRLPQAAQLTALVAAAAEAYGAPGPDHVAAAPGTQILLPLVARLIPRGRAAILGPTYAEHRRTAALAGHRAVETSDFDALAGADLAVVVNPNNPDGRILKAEHLLALADRLHQRGGLLVVDEAFMDVGPVCESVARRAGRPGLVVLRSFGKFFGLAGLRLGFALADPEIRARIEAELGPWAVAGPALEIGRRALADRSWQAAMRIRLAKEANRLDRLLAGHGLSILGGTDLYRLIETPRAVSLFETLGRRGILVRDFEADRGRLRLGLPGDARSWRRLAEGLAAWGEAGTEFVR